MKVVITGPTGAIGMALIQKCIERDIPVLAICHRESTRIRQLPKHPLVTVMQIDLSEYEAYAQMCEADATKDEKDKNDKYIRRERYAGSMSRSFYVGENMKEEDIHAKYENGILTLDVPKEQKKAVPEKRYIAIEG